jgi:hypothetical protein
MRRSHVIYTRKIPRKNYVEKDRTNGLRHSTNTKVTARGSNGYPSRATVRAKVA